MGSIGPLELVLLFLFALLVFGPKRLPEIGRSVGRSIREFKDSVSGDGGLSSAMSIEEPAPPPPVRPEDPESD